MRKIKAFLAAIFQFRFVVQNLYGWGNTKERSAKGKQESPPQRQTKLPIPNDGSSTIFHNIIKASVSPKATGSKVAKKEVKPREKK